MNNGITSSYEYVVKDIDYSVFTHIKNSVIAKRRQKRVFYEFCAKCGIDLPVDHDHKYRMPQEYIIDDSRIVRIYTMRDKTIGALFTDFNKKQQLIDYEISTLVRKIKNQKEYLDNEKKEFRKIQKTIR